MREDGVCTYSKVLVVMVVVVANDVENAGNPQIDQFWIFIEFSRPIWPGNFVILRPTHPMRKPHLLPQPLGSPQAEEASLW